MSDQTEMYAVIAVTEYYGPTTQRRIHSLHASAKDAYAAAGTNPDYDPSVGCCRLGHNQASATDLVVGTADPIGYGPWDLTTAAEDAAALAAAREALGDDLPDDEVPDEYAVEALADNGRLLLQDPEAPSRTWLVTLLDQA